MRGNLFWNKKRKKVVFVESEDGLHEVCEMPEYDSEAHLPKKDDSETIIEPKEGTLAWKIPLMNTEEYRVKFRFYITKIEITIWNEFGMEANSELFARKEDGSIVWKADMKEALSFAKHPEALEFMCKELPEGQYFIKRGYRKYMKNKNGEDSEK